MDEDYQILSFDEVAKFDPLSAKSNVENALNDLHFALHKIVESERAVFITNAIGELKRFLTAA